MRLRKLLILLVVLAILAAGAYLGFTQFDRLCTELAISHYRVRPSVKGAATLVRLLDDQSATPDQIKRVLPLLLTPRVSKDPTYPLGTTPIIRAELPFAVVLQNFIVDVNEFVWINGESRSGTGVVGIRALRKESHNLRFSPAPSKPGTYTMEIRYEYRLRPQRTRVWRWDPDKGIFLPRRAFVDIPESAQSKPKYECSIVVPVEIVMVDAGRTNP